MSSSFVFESVLWLLLVTSTVTDLISGKIYNLVTFPFLAIGLLAQVWIAGYSVMPAALLTVGTAFALFFPLYLFKAMAAGDVKLLMAFAAWSSTPYVIQIALLSTFIGGTVGLFILLKKKGFKESAMGVMHSRTRIPFAPAFLCAFMVVKIMEVKGWQLF